MLRTRSRFSRQGKRRGAATVELAVVAPFIFLLLFASLEFSRMMMVRQGLTNAAREGSRHAALVTTQNSADSKALVVDWLEDIIDQHGEEPVIRVEITPSNVSTLPPGTRITTQVEVDCADASWLPPIFFAGAKIRAVSSMTKE